jgi:hypothetical protein
MAKNSEVAHNWAAQTKTRQQTSNGSFSFNGAKLYSYQEEIGYLHPSGIALLSGTKHSTTTTRHQGDAWSAVQGRMDCLYLDLQEPSFWTAKDVGDVFISSIEEAFDSFKKARTANTKERHLSLIEDTKKKAAIAVRVFPEHNFTSVFNLIQSILDDPELGGEYLKKAREARERAEQLAKKKLISRWIKGESVRVPSPKTYLRFCLDDNEYIETSKGMTFSADKIQQVYRVWKARQKKDDTTVTIQDHRGQDWQVEITSAYIRSGCHLIDKAEIKRFAKSANWD